MDKLTKKEREIIGILQKNPFMEQEEIGRILGVSRSAVAGHLARLIKKGILQRGYILRKANDEIAVIGGANLDIKGIAGEVFQYGSSNPGTVFKTAGGVARNVAENLGRLQLNPVLYTTVGEDDEGKWLMDFTHQSGVNVQEVGRFSDERTGLYLSILNEKKEQIGSISDMQIMEKLDIAYFEKVFPRLQRVKMAFVDTNIPEDTLHSLLKWLKNRDIPTIVDPVSAKKAAKLKKGLPDTTIITPNKEEAEILSGITIKTEKDLSEVAKYLLAQGVKQVVITMGAEGTYIATDSKQRFLPSPQVRIKDTTGSGDAFAAGLIYGLTKGNNLFEACKYGHALAAITLEVEQTVATDLNIRLLEEKKRRFFNE